MGECFNDHPRPRGGFICQMCYFGIEDHRCSFAQLVTLDLESYRELSMLLCQDRHWNGASHFSMMFANINRDLSVMFAHKDFTVIFDHIDINTGVR